MLREKITAITTRSFYRMSCYRKGFFIGHKKYEQSIIFSITLNSGYLEFAFIDMSTSEVTRFINPENGVYSFPLKKGNKYQLEIRAKAANGNYKVMRKTIRDF